MRRCRRLRAAGTALVAVRRCPTTRCRPRRTMGSPSGCSATSVRRSVVPLMRGSGALTSSSASTFRPRPPPVNAAVEAVNLAARLEKHNNTAATQALAPSVTCKLAVAQGYAAGRYVEHYRGSSVVGVPIPSIWWCSSPECWAWKCPRAMPPRRSCVCTAGETITRGTGDIPSSVAT
jgi:hypothetical protein